MSANQGPDTAAVQAIWDSVTFYQNSNFLVEIHRLGQTVRPMSTVLTDKPADLTWTPGTMYIEMEGQRQLHKAFL